MDAFESIVAGIFWDLGFWTSIGYKVELTKEAKKQLGKPSLPRPEIDILCYCAKDNHLIWVECKSYIDSRGVKINSLTGEDKRGAERFKVFTWKEYREIVTRHLVKQLVLEKRVCSTPSIQYCLVTGKIATNKDRKELKDFFNKHDDWLLCDESWVEQGLRRHAEKGYENDVAVEVTKLLLGVKKLKGIDR